jgi:hypothetical protein
VQLLVHDLTLAKSIGILSENYQLNPNEKLLGDKGYIGSKIFLTPLKRKRKFELTQQEKKYNKLISRYREIVENVNSRLKNFNCLSQRWRHDLTLHPHVFKTVASIVNIDLQFHPVHQ